jgi:hypothetical protein
MIVSKLKGLPLKKFQLGVGSQESAMPIPVRNARALATGVRNPMSREPPVPSTSKHTAHGSKLKSCASCK